MLWVYDHYNLFNSFSAGIVYRRQILTSEDGARAEGINQAIQYNIFHK